jgi:RND family efflux transporter MFP subunit
MPIQPQRQSAPRRAPWWRRAVAFVLKLVVPLVILAVAGYAAREIYFSAPAPVRKPEARLARLVEVTPVLPATRGPVIEAWGAVEAAQTLTLRPEVSGRIVDVHPNLTQGGTIPEGDVLLRLDDRRLALEIARAQGRIDEISAQILMEEGQAARALRDLERSPLNLDLTDRQRALVLREPQMAELQARRDAAIADRDAAILEREKTVLTAPFDAVVVTEQVAPGASLTAGAEVATLVATDRFRVVLAMPPAALDWIDIDAGQSVRLTQPGVWPEGVFRTGRILRLNAGLTEAGRMAELIVEVRDPLARLPKNAGKPALLLGGFLRGTVEGQPVAEAVALDRAWLRDNDTVWVMTAEDKLAIRPVTVAWRAADQVLITDGLSAGDRVVTTQLAVHSEGMALRLPGEASR